MAEQYQVVAECAHVTVNTPHGRMVTLLLKGALVPADAPQLKHLIDGGFVARVGGDETGGVDASGVPAAAYEADVPAGLTTTPVERTDEQKQAKADAEVSKARAGARAKLPADGSVPDGRAGKDVFVEYLAARGYDRTELEKQDRAELLDLAKKQQS